MHIMEQEKIKFKCSQCGFLKTVFPRGETVDADFLANAGLCSTCRTPMQMINGKDNGHPKCKAHLIKCVYCGRVPQNCTNTPSKELKRGKYDGSVVTQVLFIHMTAKISKTIKNDPIAKQLFDDIGKEYEENGAAKMNTEEILGKCQKLSDLVGFDMNIGDMMGKGR